MDFAKLILLLLLVSSMGACNKESELVEAVEKNNAFKILDQGNRSGVLESKNASIAQKDDFTVLWSQHKNHVIGGGIVPEIDFTKQAIIGVFLGEKPTGGYSVVIDKITLENNTAHVYFTTILPGKNCRLTQALTSPYTIVTAPKNFTSTVFHESRQVKSCR